MNKIFIKMGLKINLIKGSLNLLVMEFEVILPTFF
jgi:hypothetical protein